MSLTEAQARVLQAMRAGSELTAHFRAARGPYYTLGGRRLGLVLLKDLEGRRLIARGAAGGAGRAAAPYTLTGAGEAARRAWEETRSAGGLDLP